MLLQWIAKYWVDFLLGLIATGLGVACRKIYTLYKNEKTHQKTKEQKEFYQGLQDLITKSSQEAQQDKIELQEQINIVKNGVLSIQKKNFKENCKELLDENHEITLEEFEALQQDYHIYKNLGGNHEGDTFYKMVVTKATENLAKQ